MCRDYDGIEESTICQGIGEVEGKNKYNLRYRGTAFYMRQGGCVGREVKMNDRAVLSYAGITNYFFKCTEFNFDDRCIFKLESDENHTNYTLHVTKRTGKVRPEKFWGSNITAVNVLTGKNGAGKTTAIRFIIENIGTGLTALHDETIVYVIRKNDEYIVFHTLYTNDLKINNSDESEISVCFWDKYRDRISSDDRSLSDNQPFFRNFIYFSNYFGTDRIYQEAGYVVDVSKDQMIYRAMEEEKSLDKKNVQHIYRRYWNKQVVEYKKDSSFNDLASKCEITYGNLLQFKLLYNRGNCRELYEKCDSKFNSTMWIGKKRRSGKNSIELAYESVINRFSVDLMWYLLQKQQIQESIFNQFLDELAATEKKTGAVIAKEQLEKTDDTTNRTWMNVLDLLNDDNKKRKAIYQPYTVFFHGWEEGDEELVLYLLSSEDDFFTCDLTSSNTDGHYSSGEESRALLFVSLYSALKIMESVQEKPCNNNIILLLDEIDAYYHPEYQVNLVNDMLELISNIFEKYNVQIIMTSNTPLELSDFPADAVIYLDKGQVKTEQNKTCTFGNNIYSLLKNNFYISSSIGEFARNKINEVIHYLNGDTVCMTKEEVEYVISIIGESIIKNKLQRMYYLKFPEEKDKGCGDL